MQEVYTKTKGIGVQITSLKQSGNFDIETISSNNPIIHNSRLIQLGTTLNLDEDLYSANTFLSLLQNVVILKRKYFLTKEHQLICEGLTHSDYTVHWPEIDASGTGLGMKIAAGEVKLDIRLNHIDHEFKKECIFIGGDTIAEPNFAHWMFEHLPKFLTVRDHCKDLLQIPIIVSSRIPDRFLDWARMLIDTDLMFVKLDLSKTIRFHKAWVVRCPTYRDKRKRPSIWERGYYALRNEILYKNTRDQPIREVASKPIEIYIPRRYPLWRKPVNEKEISEAVRANTEAFEFIPTLHSIEDQVRTVAAANLIILYGGADGALLQFTNPRCIIVEIVAPNHRAFFTSIVHCKMNRQAYFRIIGHPITGKTQNGPHPLDIDYHVDVESLKTVLRSYHNI